MNLSSPTLRFRIAIVVFMAGLVLSGVTAFPLLHELHLLARLLGLSDTATPENYTGFCAWILTIRNGLRETYAHYPWIAYGTDWLAFGHIVIAMFFIGPLINPAANRWVLIVGMVACVGVLPLALICGPLRGIPVYWRLFDCSFGVFGILPLIYCLRLIPKIEAEKAKFQTR